ncbi:alpha/beta hydrolase family protein, partial [candidate division KSB1 bacterium]
FILICVTHLTAQNTTRNPRPIGEEAFSILKETFEYDRNIPLDVRIVKTDSLVYYNREKFVITGGWGERITGYLVLPNKGRGPFPCILALHSKGRSKDIWFMFTFEKFTEELVNNGYAVLCLDAQFHGERSKNNDFIIPDKNTYRYRNLYTETVTDYRRALDYLETRSDIDSEKIGICGIDLGGYMSIILSAVDPRIKTAVNCLSAGSDTHDYAPRIETTAILTLLNKKDSNYTIGEGEYFHQQVAGKNKALKWYDSDNTLPYNWIKDATNWFYRFFK